MQVQEPNASPIRPITLTENRRSTSHNAAEIKALKRKLQVFVFVALIVGFSAGYMYKKQKDNAKKAIVAVNGKVITSDRLFTEMQMFDGQQTMHRLVGEEIQLQFAEKNGLAPTDKQAEARFNEIKNQPNFDLILRNAGLPASAYQANMKLLMAEEAVYSQGVTVTGQDVYNFYLAQSNPKNPKALFYRPAVTTLQALSTTVKGDADSAVAELNTGIPFDIVSGKYSTDATKTNGGRLNPIMFGQSPLTQFPAIESKVFALRVGQSSEPLFFNHKWWVFKCDEYAPPVQIPFNQVAEQARRDALEATGVEVNGDKVKQEFADFLKSSNIQAFWQQYAQAAGANEK